MNARARQVLFALVFVAVALYVVLGLCLPAAGATRDADSFVPLLVLVGIAAGGIGLWLALRAPSNVPPALVREAPRDDSEPAANHLYRGAPPPKLASRRTSARATVIVVLASLAFTAAALPFAFHLPRWIEAEVVLGAWWVTWAVVLAVLAYRGRPLDETHSLEIRSPFASSTATPPPPAPALLAEPRKRSRWLDWSDLGSAADPEGCLFVIGTAIVVAIALAAAWVVVELAAPALFFVAYLGVAKSLRRAIAASHRGDAIRSGLHGAIWATAYIAPLAALIAIVHRVSG